MLRKSNHVKLRLSESFMSLILGTGENTAKTLYYPNTSLEKITDIIHSNSIGNFSSKIIDACHEKRFDITALLKVIDIHYFNLKGVFF